MPQINIDVDSSIDPAKVLELRKLFDELGPDVTRRLRKVLRHTGDEIIEQQREHLLQTPLPGKVAVTGKKTVFKVVTPKSGKQYIRAQRQNVYETQERTGEHESTGMRQAIADGLATRVVAGRTRSGINIRTTSSKMPAGKRDMPKSWNSRRFRHRAWGRDDQWYYQQGAPFFFDPVWAGMKGMQASILQAIDDALKEAGES